MISSPASYKNPNGHLECLLTSDWYKHLSKILSVILNETYEFYKGKNISPMMFPVTTGSISSPMGLGSDSLPVKINIRKNDVFLADSMQFSLEIGTRLSGTGAYYIIPSFRGEQIDARHLNEFIHSEVEIYGTLDDIKQLAEEYIKHLVVALKKHCTQEITDIAGSTSHLDAMLNKKFLSIRFEDAVFELSNVKDAITELDKGIFAISGIGEQELLKRYGDFIWLTNMPWCAVPFYQAKEQGTKFSLTADLLAGIGEILGSGQRVLTQLDLQESLDYHQIDATGYKWYSEMRKIRPVQTSGFGLGIERFILWLLQHNDIRDCTLLLRDHDKIIFP